LNVAGARYAETRIVIEKTLDCIGRDANGRKDDCQAGSEQNAT
jgi:hypothetical protein